MASVSLRPLRVLVVDDNRDAADSLKTLASLWGHEVRVAYSGHAALAEARTFRPQAVLLDLSMPGLDGFAVCRRLRECPATASALILAVSGYGRAEDVQRAQEAGFDGHLLKPADPRQLKELFGRLGASLPPDVPAPQANAGPHLFVIRERV